MRSNPRRAPAGTQDEPAAAAALAAAKAERGALWTRIGEMAKKAGREP